MITRPLDRVEGRVIDRMFKRWQNEIKTKHTPLSDLQIGESFFYLHKTKKDIYNTIYQHQKKTGKQFSYIQAQNGILVKREL